jgi:hypothetical protein
MNIMHKKGSAMEQDKNRASQTSSQNKSGSSSGREQERGQASQPAGSRKQSETMGSQR